MFQIEAVSIVSFYLKYNNVSAKYSLYKNYSTKNEKYLYLFVKLGNITDL